MAITLQASPRLAGQAAARVTAPVRRAFVWLWWNSIGCDYRNLEVG
jgi:hypothetical protein